MSVAQRSIGAALADIVGAAGVRAGGDAFDGHAPRWTVVPRSVEQVSRVLALAHEAGLAVLARGSGSALASGRPPKRGDVVLDLRGLDRVLEDHPDDLTVSVEAGITAGALAERLAARSQWLPLDPAGWRGRTIGGLVATAASGPLRARYGTARDLLLGLRFVQADGVVTWGGARVVKSVTGYDVPKLMVGSLGTLGVLCELTLRLHPMPDVERAWIAGFGAAERAGDFVSRVIDSTLQPNRVELLDGATLRACGLPEHRVALVVAIGSVETAVGGQGAALAAAARAAGGEIAPAPDDMWDRYDAALTARADETVLHLSSLASHLADTTHAIERAASPLGARVGGCALLGTFRIAVSGGRPAALARLVDTLRAFVAPLGGSVTIQAGPRALREVVDPWGPVDPGAFALMREIKQAFDPTGVLNPGRFVGEL